MPISGAVTRKGLTNPLTRRVASGCYLCASDVYVLLIGSPTGSITLVSSLRKYLPLLCCIIPSSLGKYRRSFKRHQKEFLAPFSGRIFNIYQVPNHKSHLLAIYIIFHLLSFSSPPLHKNLPFYSPLFFRSPFSCRICF